MNHARRQRPIAPLVAGLTVALTVAACGAPSDSAARALESVPYDLTAPAPTVSPPSAPVPARGPHVFLLLNEVLRPASPISPASDTRTTAARTLEALGVGPSDQDRRAGLSTALGPETHLSLIELVGGRATVEIRVGEQTLGAGRLPLAVGQIVLTLTSVPGVDEVVLTANGSRIAAPLPGGALTDQPLRARDYSALTETPAAS